MMLLYTFWIFVWEFWVQLAMEVVLRMRFCGHCSAKLADYSISVKMRLFMSLLPSCRQDVALCIRSFGRKVQCPPSTVMLNGGEAARKSFVERCILIYHAKRIAYQECLSNPSTNLNVYVDSNLYVVFWLNTLIWISTWLFDLHHDLSLYTHFVCVEKVNSRNNSRAFN